MRMSPVRMSLAALFAALMSSALIAPAAPAAWAQTTPPVPPGSPDTAAQAAAAQAASAQAAAKAAAPAKTADADKPICRSSIPTGTRFPVRECHTKAQWDEMAAEAHAEVQDSQRNYSPH